MYKLSVVVPVYNCECYLNKCVDSIIDQNTNEIEIVLVDDGSTDNSGIICDNYANQFAQIKVLHQDNQGPLYARMHGINMCSGKYVSFVDADDWIEKDGYLSFFDYMDKGIDLISYGRYNDTEKSGVSPFYSIYKEGMYDRKLIESVVMPNAIWDVEQGRPGLTQALWDKIIKREHLLKSYELAGESVNIHLGEDSMILYPILQWIDTMYISRKCVYHYRQGIRRVPSYIRNDNFFDMAYFWYTYLRNNVSEIVDLNKQLDYAYLNMLKAKKECYGDYVDNDLYLFPFKKVPMNSRIVLYGAGRQGITFFNQLQKSNYCNVVLWVDKNYRTVDKFSVKNPSLILEDKNCYDYIVIAVSSIDIKKEIISWLVRHEIEKNKIIE